MIKWIRKLLGYCLHNEIEIESSDFACHVTYCKKCGKRLTRRL